VYILLINTANINKYLIHKQKTNFFCVFFLCPGGTFVGPGGRYVAGVSNKDTRTQVGARYTQTYRHHQNFNISLTRLKMLLSKCDYL